MNCSANRQGGWAWWWLAALLAPWPLMDVACAAPLVGIASYYGRESCAVNPDPRCPTASGKSLYALEGQPYAAMWNVPFGTQMKVCVKSGRCAVTTVWDRGPARKLHRVIDLDPVTFRYLSGNRRGQGLLNVTVERVTP